MFEMAPPSSSGPRRSVGGGRSSVTSMGSTGNGGSKEDNVIGGSIADRISAFNALRGKKEIEEEDDRSEGRFLWRWGQRAAG